MPETSPVNWLEAGLNLPLNAIAYHISRYLSEAFPNKALLEASGCSFDLDEFAGAGLCQVAPLPDVYCQIETAWQGAGRGLQRQIQNAAFEVNWQGNTFIVVQMKWTDGFHPHQKLYLLAETQHLADNFYNTVCEWCAEVRGEVLVFDGGSWNKSGELFRSIQSATYDNLVLPVELKQTVAEDIDRFFRSRDVYQQYGIPWKRGLIFIGPPGNGKTHMVKAILNAAKVPCLYVKSFKAQYSTDHDSIRAVFHRARQTTPCALIFEDLDALIDDQNRSFFLNELDGFAENAGILTLATTNHPERLDTAIVDRPSRFDRKYHFPLPAPAERETYMTLWSKGLPLELVLQTATLAEVAERTEGFSFAYLKELCLASLMHWMDNPETQGSFDTVLLSQARLLREQMGSMNIALLPASSEIPTGDEEEE